jgi:hypothetical protein
MPSYKLQVWYWRTHDMLLSEESNLITDKQKITCSSSLPLTVAQFAHSKGTLIVWEVHGTQKFCKLIKRKVPLGFEKVDGPFQDIYSIEGNIQIVNKHGDIYYVIPSSGSVNLISKWNGEKGENNSCIAYIRNGILVAGPDGTLKYFKRQKYVWNEIFQSPSPEPFTMLKCFHDNDTVIGTTINGELHKITLADGDKINISQIKFYDAAYEYFAMIYPAGDHLVVVDSANNIKIKRIVNGEKISTIDISNQTVVQSNPCFPFIAVGTRSGDVTFISLFDPQHPKMLVEFLLSRWSIVNMKFSDGGNYLVVIDADNNFFILRSVVGEKMTILHYFRENLNFEDFFFIESRTKLDLMFLRSTSDEAVGDSLLKIVFQLDDFENEEKHEWILPSNYSNVLPICGETEKFYAIESGSRSVEVLVIDEDSINVDEVIETPHQLRHIQGYNDGEQLVTWSIDGTVAAFDIMKNHSLIVSFVAGNRHNYGTRIAHCNARCELMVTLDQSGNLISSKVSVDRTVKAQQELDEIMEKSAFKVVEMFSETTSGGFPGLSIEHYGKKFTDLKSEQTYQMEALESKQTRKEAFAKLENLRAQVKKMLDENEKIDEDEKLEIQDFNLNLTTTTQKEQEAREERENEEKKMMDFIEAQTKMNNWIIEKCWNPMEVKGAKLRGMFIGLFVDNFALVHDPVFEDKLRSIQTMRAIEFSVAREDVFLPWRPIPTM